MWLELFLTGVLGGLLGLDRRAVMQVMVSSPLVAATVTGMWMGDAGLGVLVGTITALLWIHELPVGGNIPPNDTVIAVLVTFLAAQLAELGEAPLQVRVVLGLLWAIPFGLLAQRLDGTARRFNVALSRWVVQGRYPAQQRMLLEAQGVGVLTAFAGATLSIWLGGLFGLLLLPVGVSTLPAAASRALGVVFYLLPLLGVAAGVTTINRRRSWWTVIALFVLFNILAPMVGC